MKGFSMCAALAALLAVGIGCGDDDDDVTADASAVIDALAPAIDAEQPADATTVCNTLAQTASEVAQTRVDENPPTATGGGVPDGTYHGVADVLYTGPGGGTGPSGIVTTFTSRCIALACDQVAADPPLNEDVGATYSVEVTDEKLAFTGSCPEPGTSSATHTTMTDEGGTTTVIIYRTIPGAVRARTFELQP